MKRSEYLSKVSDIYGMLATAISDFKESRISATDLQNIIRKSWTEMPKSNMLVDSDLAETLELDETMIGQVIESAPYRSEDVIALENEIVDNIITDIADDKSDHYCRISVCGSNSLIQNVIGYAEWMYFAFGRI